MDDQIEERYVCSLDIDPDGTKWRCRWPRTNPVCAGIGNLQILENHVRAVNLQGGSIRPATVIANPCVLPGITPDRNRLRCASAQPVRVTARIRAPQEPDGRTRRKWSIERRGEVYRTSKCPGIRRS